MTQWLSEHIPCPCGKSSDAYCIHNDGHGFCFSCRKTFYTAQSEIPMTEQINAPKETFTYEYLARRGISKETHEFFGAKTQINSKGEPVSVAYPHPNGYKQIRFLETKDFRFVGENTNVPGGFFRDKFPAGSAKAVTVVEGFDDGMSAYQMLGKYPVYSVRSSSSALSDVRRDYDYLNSFEKIYLALDDDEPGQRATTEIAACFDFNKVYHVRLAPYKDPHEFLEAGKTADFRSCWYNAGRFLPEGVVSSFRDIDDILDNAKTDPGHPWPFPTLTHFTDGIKRKRGYLLTGLEGTGKTEFFHAVEHHLAKTDPEANIAIIHLEEPLDENVKKMVGYELQVPTTFADSTVSNEDIKKTYRAIAGREDRIHFYNHYGSDNPEVLEAKIRFFVAACKCKYVFLDNITIIATGRMQDDERKELDWLSTRLEMMLKQLDFTLFVISHENDVGQTRGSRNISKVFDVWINCRRDIKSDNAHTRNILELTLNKGRGCRGTGPCGKLIFDETTGTISEMSDELPV